VDTRLYVVNVEAVVWGEARGKYLMIVRGETEDIAPGTLTPPGGKVEVQGLVYDVLEETLRREVTEETGVELKGGLGYVESHSFDAGASTIVDIVFLARYASGTPAARDGEEVASIEWLTCDDIMSDPRVMPWTRDTMRLAEARRQELGW
jgi:8-oxo-dGTP pyrophosphatase MutT (NUDIX family)